MSPNATFLYVIGVNPGAIAFRRLVYKFSQQINQKELRAIVYIRLYDCYERYQSSNFLEVLSKLEMDGAFSPINPAGLIEVAKDILRSDLVDMVKHFMKAQRQTATEDSQRSRMVEHLKKLQEEGIHSLRMLPILSIVSHTACL